MERLLLIGLDPAESSEITVRYGGPVIAYATLPKIRLDRGTLLVERRGAVGAFLPVDRVVFHGIFDDDFDALTQLALWGGPCLPSARGMMDLRQRVPGLIRSLAVSRFGRLARSFADRGTVIHVDRPSVAKWGSRHCGDDKERFADNWTCDVPTLVEDFVDGEAVRLALIGEQAWQIRLTGETWKKSIHPDNAAFIPVDARLLDDTRRLQQHFGLVVIANDYILSRDGTPYLLEVNHIPNVTRFEAMRSAYIDLVIAFARDTLTKA